jgi:Zn-dependent peptidase ImmA (M78 family)
VTRRLSRPRQLARDLLVEVGARTPEQIDPIETAKEKGIEVTFGQLTGATARIYRIGGKARIRVSDDIVTEGRRRTSIMHEVGHFVLGHELPKEGDRASWLKMSCKHRDHKEEREADVLAVEHLTPEPMVREHCKLDTVDLQTVHSIEHKFRASPVMAAVRLVELSSHPCAVVYSVRGRIAWMKPSKTFPTYSVKGAAVGTSSLASEYFERGAIPNGPRSGLASAWFSTSTRIAPDAEMTEEATLIPEPGWGGVMSLLWVRAPAQPTK